MPLMKLTLFESQMPTNIAMNTMTHSFVFMEKLLSYAAVDAGT
jgi:hypothetical protein